MFAAVRQYELGAGTVDELLVAIAELTDEIRDLPGFVGYQVIASGSDEIVTVSVFEDEPSALRSTELALAFLDHLDRFEIRPTSAMNGKIALTEGALV
jgi:quinol monooxygenase YgiN